MEEDTKKDNQVNDHGSTENTYETKDMTVDESLSDISISTISNSSGIESDVYKHVVKRLKKKKTKERRKRLIQREKKRKKINHRVKKEKSRKVSRKSSNNERNDINDLEWNSKETSKRKRNERYSRSPSQLQNDLKRNRVHKGELVKVGNTNDKKKKKEELIPEDPFNPLLLAYVKNKKIKTHHKNKKEQTKVNDRWKHDKYETDSTDEDNEESNQRSKCTPEIDLTDVRKNVWRSKAGGVCIVEHSDGSQI